MATPSYILSNDALARHQKASIDIIYDVTGAKAGKFATLAPQAIKGYDATDFVQADIDALLGSTNEFLATAFGSTAMDTGAFGLILNCGGQVAAVHGVEILALAGTTQTQQVGLVAAMADSSAAVARVAKSDLGNLALQCVVTDLDAATAGKLLIKILVDLK
jgi:hypothetical protein